MRVAQALVIPLVLSSLTACGDEPLDRPGTCSAETWQQAIPIADGLWTDTGVRTADDGDHVLVVWQQRIENGKLDDQLMAVLLDSATGEVVRETQIVESLDDLWSFDVTPTRDGFLVFAFDADRMFVKSISAAGDIDEATASQPTRYTGDHVVIGDDDGATVLAFGLDVVRVDTSGAIVSSTTPLARDAHCLDGVALGGGRLLAWCVDFGDDDDGASFFMQMNLDGSDAVVIDSTGALDAALAGTGNGRNGHLARVDAGVIVAFEVDNDAFAALFDDDGLPLIDATKVGSAPPGQVLLGNDICTDICDGLTVTAEGDAVVVGFESMSEATSNDTKVSLVALDVGVDGVSTDAAAERTLAPVHAHAASNDGTGTVMSFIDIGGFHFPWEWPPQTLRIERRCGA